MANMYIPDGKSLTNEGGFNKIYETGVSGYIIIGFIATPKEIVIFETNNTVSTIMRLPFPIRPTDLPV